MWLKECVRKCVVNIYLIFLILNLMLNTKEISNRFEILSLLDNVLMILCHLYCFNSAMLHKKGWKFGTN